MNIEDSKAVIKVLQTSFKNSMQQDDVHAWIEFFETQDYIISKKVADWYRNNSPDGWLPSIAQFSVKIREQQIGISQNEALRRNSGACDECSGLTWSTRDPSGLIPCSQCRSSSFAKWQELKYGPGSIIDEDERNGVQTAHQIASEPVHQNGHPVSDDRAKQWTTHLLSKSPTVYPEGNIEIKNESLEDVVQDKEQQFKDNYVEF